MYSKAEADSEKSFWPAAELNVSGTTFITLLNNPSTLSPPEKNRIISSLSTSASAHSRWKTFRELEFSFDYTDNSKLKNIVLYRGSKLKPRLKPIRAKLQVKSLTQCPNWPYTEWASATKSAEFHCLLLKHSSSAAPSDSKGQYKMFLQPQRSHSSLTGCVSSLICSMQLTGVWLVKLPNRTAYLTCGRRTWTLACSKDTVWG